MKKGLLLLFFLIYASILSAQNISWFVQGHVNGLNSAVLSPDKKSLLLSKYGTEGYRLELWDIISKQNIFSIDSISVYQADFSSDNTLIAYNNLRRLVIVDLVSKKQIANDTIIYVPYKLKFIPNSSKVIFLASSDGGNSLIYCIYNYITHSVEDTISIKKETPYVNSNSDFVISPDGKYLLTSFRSFYSFNDSIPYNLLLIYNLETKLMLTKKIQYDAINSIFITPDSKYFITTATNYEFQKYSIYYCDIATADTIMTFRDTIIYSPAFISLNAKGDLLRILYISRGFANFKLATGEVDTLCNIKSTFNNYWFTSDKQFISAEGDNLIYWSLPNDPKDGLMIVDTLKQYSGPKHIKSLRSVAISPDDKIVATSGGEDLVKIWNCTDGAFLYDIQCPNSNINNLSFSPSGDKLAFISNYPIQELWIYDLIQKKFFTGIKQSDQYFGNITWSKDESFIAVPVTADSISYFNIETGKSFKSIYLGKYIYCYDISKDWKYLVSGTWNNKINLIDLETGLQILSDSTTLKSNPNNLSFSSKSNYIVASCGNGFAMVFNTNDLSLVKKYDSKTKNGKVNISMASIMKAKFSNSDKLIYALLGGIIKVWEVGTGIDYKVYDDNYPYQYGSINEEIQDFAISNDETFFITVSRAGSVIKWNSADVTNVAENIEANGILFYPNPAHDFIYINDNEITNIEIYSIQGIKLLESKNRKKIDISSLSDGLYFLKINAKIYKLIKVK